MTSIMILFCAMAIVLTGVLFYVGQVNTLFLEIITAVRAKEILKYC